MSEYPGNGVDYGRGLGDGLEWGNLDRRVRNARRSKINGAVWAGLGAIGLVLTLWLSAGFWPGLIYSFLLVLNLFRALREMKAEQRAIFERDRWLADRPHLSVVEAE